MTPEQCIKAIRTLPDSRLEAHGITTDRHYRKDDDSLVLGAAREEHEATADWLQYLWLNHSWLTNKLTGTWRVCYKPHAERLTSFWELSREIYLRAAWMQEQSVSPLKLTLTCAIEICENKFVASGYFSDHSAIQGKHQNYKDATEYYNTLEKVSELQFARGKFWLRPIKALEETAAAIAAHDPSFRNNHYRRYLKAQKSYHRDIVRGELNVFRLCDGKPFLAGRGNQPAQTKRVL